MRACAPDSPAMLWNEFGSYPRGSMRNEFGIFPAGSSDVSIAVMRSKRRRSQTCSRMG